MPAPDWLWIPVTIWVALGDRLNLAALLAIACDTAGVLLLSPADKRRPLRAPLSGWTGKPALLGVASGTAFALAAVGYRGAALSFDNLPYLAAAAANARTLGLVELIYSYVVSLKLFRERLSAMELGGMALIALGIIVVTLGR